MADRKSLNHHRGTNCREEPLIDGQQRLTSASVLLAYLHRYLSNYVGNISFGTSDCWKPIDDLKYELPGQFYYMRYTKKFRSFFLLQ